MQHFILEAVNSRVGAQVAELSREIHNKAKLRHHIAGLFKTDGSGAAGFRAWALDVARDLGADEEIFVVAPPHASGVSPEADPAPNPATAGPDLAEVVRIVDERLAAVPNVVRAIVAEEFAQRPPPMAIPTAVPIAAQNGGGYDRNARTPFAFGLGGPAWMGRR